MNGKEKPCKWDAPPNENRKVQPRNQSDIPRKAYKGEV